MVDRPTERRATYRLVVRGELSSRFGYFFNGLDMDVDDGTTVLTGSMIDQAQLHGYLARMEELGLQLVRVEQMDTPDERSGPR